MKTVNAIIKKTHADRSVPYDRYCYRIVLVKEDGTRVELPSNMSLSTATAVQKLFRKNA